MAVIANDPIIFLCQTITILLYAVIFIVSLIYTFSIDTYRKLDETLNFSFLEKVTSNPLEQDIDFLNDWLIDNNKIVGPCLVLLSAFDLFMLTASMKVL